MYELAVTFGILYIVYLIIRSYVIYHKTTPQTRKERRSAPYYYNSPKQGTVRAQDCGKLLPKTTEKP